MKTDNNTKEQIITSKMMTYLIKNNQNNKYTFIALPFGRLCILKYTIEDDGDFKDNVIYMYETGKNSINKICDKKINELGEYITNLNYIEATRWRVG